MEDSTPAVCLPRRSSLSHSFLLTVLCLVCDWLSTCPRIYRPTGSSGSRRQRIPASAFRWREESCLPSFYLGSLRVPYPCMPTCGDGPSQEFMWWLSLCFRSFSLTSCLSDTARSHSHARIHRSENSRFLECCGAYLVSSLLWYSSRTWNLGHCHIRCTLSLWFC